MDANPFQKRLTVRKEFSRNIVNDWFFLAEKNDNVIKWDQDPKSSRVPVAYPHEQHVITPTDRTYKTNELKLQHSQGLYRLTNYISNASNRSPHICSQGHDMFRFRLKLWSSSSRGSKLYDVIENAHKQIGTAQ